MSLLTIIVYCSIAFAGYIIVPTLIIILIDIILDVGLNPFIHLEIAHTIFVYPIMLGFIHLRFDIQKRDEMDFFFFSFTDYEKKLIKQKGYAFKEDIDFFEMQNAFGAKKEGVSCTTTVYNRGIT